jgi:hypothetical protein
LILRTCIFFAAVVRIYASGQLLEANHGQVAQAVYFLARNAAVSGAVDSARVTGSYALQTRRIASGSHRRDPALASDPLIDFSYIVNGNGDDRGCQVALDGAGNIYIAGLTLSPDFETTPGAAFGSPVRLPGSYYQVFVRKLSPDGSKLIYSTYLGLSSFYSAHPLALRVDQSGNAYLALNLFDQGLAGGGTPIDPNGAVAV